MKAHIHEMAFKEFEEAIQWYVGSEDQASMADAHRT
jgi:hypothetical protein